MFELVTLILVLHVAVSIYRRSAERQRDVERLKTKVADLSKLVVRLQQSGRREEIPEQIIQLELRDLCSQLHDQITAGEQAEIAFEHLHFVEESISKSIVVAAELPTTAESTLQ